MQTDEKIATWMQLRIHMVQSCSLFWTDDWRLTDFACVNIKMRRCKDYYIVINFFESREA